MTEVLNHASTSVSPGRLTLVDHRLRVTAALAWVDARKACDSSWQMWTDGTLRGKSASGRSTHPSCPSSIPRCPHRRDQHGRRWFAVSTQVAAAVERAVALIPPLSDEQRTRIAVLLRGAS